MKTFLLCHSDTTKRMTTQAQTEIHEILKLEKTIVKKNNNKAMLKHAYGTSLPKFELSNNANDIADNKIIKINIEYDHILFIHEIFLYYE